MELKLEYPGQVKHIYSVILRNDESPAVEFLKRLRQDNISSHKTMVRRYKRHADNGPSSNKQHERHIRGNLWEFKTSQGDRLLYFNHPNGSTVITNGFHKGDPPDSHFNRAEEYRDAILEEAGNDDC